MRKFFSLLALAGLLSCSKPAKQDESDKIQLETQPAFSFQGKVFFLGPSKKECKIYAECDCCTSELVFINESDFVLVDFCTEENIWTTGTYRADSIALTLTFQQKAVVSAVDLFKPESGPTITLDTAQIKPITFPLTKCENGDVMLERNEDDDYKYGLRNLPKGEVDAIREVLESKQWKILNEK